jgi:galactose mutarotase-like enzyme
VCGTHAATFLLSSSADTLEVYPFHFKFYLHYTIKESTLIVAYEVVNTGGSTMYFSVGAHPAFAVPLVSGTLYDDYYLAFEKKEALKRWPITADGLIDAVPIAVPTLGASISLTKELFSKDALVLKHLQSSVISLLSSKTPHGLRFSFAGFPYMGIWAAKGADFVCIEPWCGIADSVHSNQQLTQKEGIETLLPEKNWKRNWQVELF